MALFWQSAVCYRLLQGKQTACRDVVGDARIRGRLREHSPAPHDNPTQFYDTSIDLKILTLSGRVNVLEGLATIQ